MPDLLAEHPEYSKAELGTVLTVLSIAYGLSKFLMGSISDRSNPKYFLPLGLLLMAKLVGGPMILVGWAKPVPGNVSNLRHPKRDMIWVAAAGPGANLVMAAGWILVFGLATAGDGPGSAGLVQMARAGLDFTAREPRLTRITGVVNAFELAVVHDSETGRAPKKGYEIDVPQPLIDFGDAFVGPPAADFATFASHYGWERVGRALEGYAASAVLRETRLAEAQLFGVGLGLYRIRKRVALQQPAERIARDVAFLEATIEAAGRLLRG